MNENLGTTKLLSMPRTAGGAGSISTSSVAIRIGARSSSIALVDGSDSSKLLIFQITYTEEKRHKELCLDFLASGEERHKIERVLLDRTVPELASRLPDLIDRICIVNYAEMLPKSAALLFALAESQDEHLLYPGQLKIMGSSPGDNDSCIFINSTEAGSHVTKMLSGQELQTAGILPAEKHQVLLSARHRVAQLFPEDLLADRGCNESIDFQLSCLLHNLRLDEQSDEFRRNFASCVEPALQAYATLVSNLEPQTAATCYICDCIFNSEFCRQELAKNFKQSQPQSCKTIRFVKDIGLLGFLGALAAAEQQGSNSSSP